MSEIQLPKDMVEGKECLQYRVPWQVPASIYKEHELLRADDIVLEIGSGGSTLFFAGRVNFVYSIETDSDWKRKVADELIKSGYLINKCIYISAKDEQEICELISDFPSVTVFSVDPEGNFNRSKILNTFLSNGVPPILRMIILDNYAHEGLFPEHYNKDWKELEGWEVVDFNHERWAGSGTRILIKKQ